MISDFLLIYAVIIFGACLQSLAGFGLGLLSAPLVYFLNPELVPAPMILLALLNTSILAQKYRKDIDMSKTKMSIFGGTIGVILAAFVVKQINAQQFQVIFGMLILGAVVASALGITPKINKLSNLIASFISGVMGTITSAGGAPMGILYQSEEKQSIKANLSAFFVYINLIAIVALASMGTVGQQDIIYFLQFSPAIFIGLLMAKLLNNKINGNMVRILVLSVAAISGIVLIF